ncbi:oligosaccharide flippase family protein [Vibrio parahaemolyticus]|uniref:Polysaccharide biosynthesis protein n=1 Tax=Vibrio parahaemolyticus TaxID=670 RepID=A0A5P4S767_VIBPH|nr:oligosaccharide flippase family protein [Vibrio parahaemolyticus]QFC18194.1 polysaccharide biosynthesis protein [Vibrio parahaemolyticus]QOS17272.1 hypothetical protein VP407_00018 [Vibrio parahaemolyticus]QOS17349.1 hypothetical protein VP16_00018 [Vibrio parahaemolyticus]QOS20328.1 hypothetical protein VP23_00018 [Vibrio parahaemolyticus]QOS21660.1 hypothetical protein VP208_00018 [Vibrio parahaemolyticus]
MNGTFKNSFILVLIRAIQYGFPLLIYPYFLSLFGLKKFGELSFWLSVTYFIGTLVSLNMESHASQMLFKSSGVELERKKTIAIPLIIRLLVFFLSVAGWLSFSLFYASSYEHMLLIMFSCYPLLSIGLQPNFYFMALGDYLLSLKTIVIEKIIFLLLVFSIITSDELYYLVPMCYFMGYLVSFLFLYRYIMSSNKIKLFDYIKPDYFGMFRSYTKISLKLLLGKMTQVHTSLSKFLVGIIFNYELVAIYDVIEKVVNALKVPLVILFQATYSRLKMSKKETEKLFIGLVVCSIITYSIALYMDEYILTYFLKGNVESALCAYKIMLLVVLSVPFMQAYGAGYIVKVKGADIYANIMIVSNLISMTVLLLLYFSSIDFNKYVMWVVFAEFIFAMLCLSLFMIYNFKSKKVVN